MLLSPPKLGGSTKPINEQAAEANVELDESRKKIPDVVYLIRYKIYGVEYEFNLKPLLEIDVTELSELTLNNLRVQMEKISSIRTTFGKAYEQMMEEYGLWMIGYDIWEANALESARKQYWKDQNDNSVKYQLAKSSMKPPTQDDLKNSMLTIPGLKVEYEMKMEEKIKFQRKKSEFERIDDILNKRGFELKTIIDSRVSRNG